MITLQTMSESSLTTNATRQIPSWHMRADYVETCNCDCGCQCNFTGFPTYGFCRALVLYHIRDGNYVDNIKLDSLEVIYAVSWPKAIHEGNGIMQLFITKNSNENQRQAIVDIFTGIAKGHGPFVIFARILRYILDLQYIDIIAKVDGRKSSFSVPEIRDVQVENFVNPVTGEEQDTKIQLSKGFIFKLCRCSKNQSYENIDS